MTFSPAALCDRLASKGLALALFFVLALVLIPETFAETLRVWFTPAKTFLLCLLALNLGLCTWQRFRTLRRSTLLIHLGCLLIMAGGVAGQTGSLLTVNIHEGSTAATAYDWKREQEVELDFQLEVTKIGRIFYPVPIRVGVVEEGIDKKLYEVRTGTSFSHGGYRITVQDLDPQTKDLQLAIHRDDTLLGHYRTAGDSALPADFPLEFKLVAFKPPALQRIWVELAVRDDQQLLSTGISEVNQPLIWQGWRMFNTENGTDRFGFPYAGIQLVRDPGIPLVYLGFIVLCLGCLLRLATFLKE